MKGLILKDLFVLRKTARVFIILMVLYAAMAFFLHTDFGVLMAFITGMLSVTSFAYDEQAKWDAYALTMPVSKREMVAAKYLLALLLGIAGGIAGLVLSTVSGLGSGSLDTAGILVNTGLAVCATYLFSSIAIPLLYKLGAEKSRLVLMMCYAVPIIGVTILLNWFSDASVSVPDLMAAARTAAIALPFLAAAALAISYRVSLAVFGKKDV